MLTPAQLATLKTDAEGQSSLTAAIAAKDWPTVAAFYAEASSPAVTIWRADVKPSEIVAAITYTELVALTSPKQFALQVLLQPGVVDATSANVRAAFSAIFGTSASLTALTALAERTATRLEALFTTAEISAVYGYTLSGADVSAAMGW